MTDSDGGFADGTATVLSLWQVTPKGAYRAAFEWADSPGECAGYLVLTSVRDGHRFETAVSWAQLSAFQREAARRLHTHLATQQTGELPRINPGPTPPAPWAPQEPRGT